MTLTERRHRLSVLLALVALASVADWWCLAGPRWTALVKARARLVDHRQELAAARVEIATRVDTKRAVREAARALRHAARRLPDQREVAALLGDVARSARAARLDLLLLRPRPEHAASDHVDVPVELQVRGSYRDTLGFLGRLEELGRLVRIGSLRIERPERAKDRLVLRVSCTAMTYRMLGEDERRAAQRAGQERG